MKLPLIERPVFPLVAPVAMAKASHDSTLILLLFTDSLHLHAGLGYSQELEALLVIESPFAELILKPRAYDGRTVREDQTAWPVHFARKEEALEEL